jgi:hypothetical protein
MMAGRIDRLVRHTVPAPTIDDGKPNMREMRHIGILLSGLLLTCCNADPMGVTTIGSLDCQTRSACYSSAVGHSDADGARAALVDQDVRAILEGMRASGE